MKAELKKKGKPIPENDIWIAALAIQYTATLVTKDKHFKNIDGLQIESW
ncbi:MAG: PIN domain-containing protein [Spirochaetota bacterium]